MRVINSIEKFNKAVEKESERVSFVMTNKNKGFAWITPQEVSSKYQGIFFNENKKMFRVIESINSKENINFLKNNFYNVETDRAEYFMPDELNAFVYESDSENKIFLDFKEAYSDDYASYSVELKNDVVLVEIDYKNEKYYLAIRFKGEFVEKKEWIFRKYSFDTDRKSFPDERNVFFIGSINSKKIIFYFSQNKDEAINNSKILYEGLNEYKEKKKKRMENIFLDTPNDKKIDIAYNSCKILLDNLSDKEGIFAGLPWFFQYWSRDELISLKGLYSNKENISKKILKKWVNYLKKDLTVFPAKLKIDLAEEGNSIDSAGWLLKRLELFPELLGENIKKLNEIFSELDKKINEKQENTWMDSISRKAGIEIQVMKLFALNLAQQISEEKQIFAEKEKLLKENIKKNYWDGKNLFDSLDKKIRPNVFIVYYFYPNLIEKKEWETCLDNLIKETWCDWGGFSTISKKDPLFFREHTGEDGKSYHNGDSWFWVNNLAGLVLCDLNQEKYSNEIKKILDASTEEILFSGAIANHSEISSASSLKSQGAISQSWSAAMYIEFIDKLNEKKFI